MADVPEAPAIEQDKPVDAPEAPDTGQATTGEEESFIDSFNLNDVPEDARPHVEALQKQWQSTYSSKRQAERQELDEIRREAEQARQFQAAIQNPQTRAAVLQQFGIEMVDDEDELPDEEPDLYDRLERVEGQLTQREQAEQQARQQEAVTDFVAEQIESLEKSEDREFDAKEHQLLDAYAKAFPTPEGYPNVKGAYELLTGIVSERQKAWVESKKAPRRPANGTPASQAADLSNPETRRQRMAEAAEAARASQE